MQKSSFSLASIQALLSSMSFSNKENQGEMLQRGVSKSRSFHPKGQLNPKKYSRNHLGQYCEQSHCLNRDNDLLTQRKEAAIKYNREVYANTLLSRTGRPLNIF